MRILTSHFIRDHVLLGAFAALLLIPVFSPRGSLFFWLATLGMDLDHYLNFLYYTGGKFWGIGSLFKFCNEVFSQRDREEFLDLEIFHTVEFVTVLALVTFGFFRALIPVFWGILFHLGTDYFHLRHYRILQKRSHSLWGYLQRKKKMAAEGKNPERIFREAVSVLSAEKK